VHFRSAPESNTWWSSASRSGWVRASKRSKQLPQKKLPGFIQGMDQYIKSCLVRLEGKTFGSSWLVVGSVSVIYASFESIIRNAYHCMAKNSLEIVNGFFPFQSRMFYAGSIGKMGNFARVCLFYSAETSPRNARPTAGRERCAQRSAYTPYPKDRMI